MKTARNHFTIVMESLNANDFVQCMYSIFNEAGETVCAKRLKPKGNVWEPERRWKRQRCRKCREKRTLHAIEELNGGWNITIPHSLWNRHKCEILFIFFFSFVETHKMQSYREMKWFQLLKVFGYSFKMSEVNENEKKNNLHRNEPRICSFADHNGWKKEEAKKTLRRKPINRLVCTFWLFIYRGKWMCCFYDRKMFVDHFLIVATLAAVTLPSNIIQKYGIWNSNEFAERKKNCINGIDT